MQRRIFCFWTGNNPLSDRRRANLAALRAGTGVEVVLVTPRNLHDFLPATQLHPAYVHLNLAHRSDYLRCYFMRRYGGGYSDIKRSTHNWQQYFDEIEANPQLWVVGYPEIGPGGIANLYSVSRQLGTPWAATAQAWLSRKWLQAHWRRLIGCGAYICRPGTPLLEAWWAEINLRLDRLLPALQAAPARYPRERAGEVHDGAISAYPVPWTYLNGAILQPLFLRHVRHLSQTLPTPEFSDYL